MGTRGVQRSMELFLAFPFNNVLHRHVATLVTAVDRSSPRLAQFLLQDCNLLDWLVDAPTQVGRQPSTALHWHVVRWAWAACACGTC